MPVLTTSQRAHELLTVLGENAAAWFALRRATDRVPGLDEFTLQGRVIEELSPTRIQATDPVTVLTELRGCLARHCCTTARGLQ